MPLDPTIARSPDPRLARWAGRAGVAAFLFFLLKGLAWLAAPLLLFWFD